MALNNQEIEIKLPITKLQYKKINNTLSRIGKFIKFSQQEDIYFTPLLDSFLKAKYPYKWLSIRKRDSNVILNFKHWYPENTKYTTHCDEYETRIYDLNQLEKILNALNFEKIVTVKKKRRVYKYQDLFEISLDQVDDLGYFVEIETIKDLGSVKNAYKHILAFSKKLGVTNRKKCSRWLCLCFNEKEAKSPKHLVFLQTILLTTKISL